MASKDVDLVKEKLDLVEFIRSYVVLTPAGKNFKGLCPFHPEKTPSFIVSPERKTWHCFGCAEGGDLISFVMKYEHLEFPEALRFLAERAGIELAHLNPQAEREFGVLYALHDAAASFYRDEFKKCIPAQDYWKKRTLTPATLEEFGIGFALGGEVLTLHLIKKGFSVDDIVRAGLAGKTAGGMYRDRFQNRVMFPIENQVGKIVAFTGRIMPSAAVPRADGSEPPKYLNSPESPIFLKSRILYGFSKTKNDISRAREAVLMEGQMDFLLGWQSGVKNAVAVSGTGLTREHLDRLRRIADSLSVCFDNDSAGLKALERSLDTLSRYDFHLKAVDLGSYKDPGEACERDPGYLEKAVAEAKPAFERLTTALFSSGATDIAERKRIVHMLLSKVKRLRSSAEQSAWLRTIATQSGISEVSLFAELAELPADEEEKGSASEAEPVRPASPKRLDMIAARLIALAFTKPEFLARVKAIVHLMPAAYRRILESPTSAEAGFLEMQSSVLVEDDPKAVNKEFDELLKQASIEDLKTAQAGLKEKLHRAEADGKDDEVSVLTKEFTDVSHKLNELRSSA